MFTSSHPLVFYIDATQMKVSAFLLSLVLGVDAIYFDIFLSLLTPRSYPYHQKSLRRRASSNRGQPQCRLKQTANALTIPVTHSTVSIDIKTSKTFTNTIMTAAPASTALTTHKSALAWGGSDQQLLNFAKNEKSM